eukprot:307955-Chlamydomonas_euryale.AAC.2
MARALTGGTRGMRAAGLKPWQARACPPPPHVPAPPCYPPPPIGLWLFAAGASEVVGEARRVGGCGKGAPLRAVAAAAASAERGRRGNDRVGDGLGHGCQVLPDFQNATPMCAPARDGGAVSMHMPPPPTPPHSPATPLPSAGINAAAA